MTVQQPWARHFQNVWHERAGDPALPDWLRVACLAYGSHRANGHAIQAAGNVALVLARCETTTGVMKEPTRQNVHRAVRLAVQRGWLVAGSTARCLIVPAHAIQGGLGDSGDACPQHSPLEQKRRRTRLLKAVGDDT